MNDRADLERRAEGGVIGGVRILVGLMWLANLHWKVPPDFGADNGSGLYKYADSVSRHSTFALYGWINDHIILQHFTFFGWVTVITETCLAALLLIGYRTRIVALVGAAMATLIFFSVIYYDRADEWSWSYFLMIGIHLLLAAVSAGDHVGLDGVLAEPPDRSRGALRVVGGVATIVGVLGLFVARSVDFAGRQVALLGSDGGFVDEGKITRRWELKFLWFNPLWALLTIAGGVLLIVGYRQLAAAWAGVAMFGAMAVVVFASETFAYVRDDGGTPRIGTASNAAFWAAMALAGGLLAGRVAGIGRTHESLTVDAVPTTGDAPHG